MSVCRTIFAVLIASAAVIAPGVVPGAHAGTGDHFRVELLGRRADGPCYDVAARGNVAYFGNGSYLQLTDFSNSAQPAVLARVVLPTVVRGLYLFDDRVYVACGVDGIRIVNVAAPTAAREVGAVAPVGANFEDVACAGSVAYGVDLDRGLRTIKCGLTCVALGKRRLV